MQEKIRLSARKLFEMSEDEIYNHFKPLASQSWPAGKTVPSALSLTGIIPINSRRVKKKGQVEYTYTVLVSLKTVTLSFDLKHITLIFDMDKLNLKRVYVRDMILVGGKYI